MTGRRPGYPNYTARRIVAWTAWLQLVLAAPLAAQVFVLEPTDVGADNPQVAPHVPVSQLTGFGRRSRLGSYVPFAFRLPDRAGLPPLTSAVLEVTIAQIQTTAAGADTVEASGIQGWPGEVLFRNFNTLYAPGEDPLTPKVITIDLLALAPSGEPLQPLSAAVLRNEERLYVVQRENSSVLGASLRLVYGGTAPTATAPSATPQRSTTPASTSSAGTASPSPTPTGTRPTATPTATPGGTRPTVTPTASPTTGSDGKCRIVAATDAPVAIADGGVTRSLLDVAFSGTVAAVRVRDLRGFHSFMGDLEVRLVSPAGSEVVILDRVCSGTAGFDLDLDDRAGAIECPVGSGRTFRPANPLGRFRDEPVRGTWTLEVFDRAAEDQGFLQGWALELCYEPTAPQADCTTHSPAGLPKSIPAGGSLSSSVAVGARGTVRAVSVLDLSGSHPDLRELAISLAGPSGREITLLQGACAEGRDFDLSFDDLDTAPVPCPPTDGLAHRPATPLQSFAGEPAAGDWTLRVGSPAQRGDGTLDSWVLRLCTDAVATIGTRTPTPTATPTATATRTPLATLPAACGCAGDCGCDGRVTVNEIVTLVGIALGDTAATACRAADVSRDGRVTIDELLQAIERVLEGCPG